MELTTEQKEFIIVNLTNYQLCNLLLKYELKNIWRSEKNKTAKFKEIAVRFNITVGRVRNIYYSI